MERTPTIQIVSFNELPTRRKTEIIRGISNHSLQAQPHGTSSLARTLERLAYQNPTGLLLALKEGQPVGYCCSIRLNARPTSTELERIRHEGIDRMHRPRGSFFYVVMLELLRTARGQSIDRMLARAQFQAAHKQGFARIHFLAEDRLRNYHQRVTGAKPTNLFWNDHGTLYRWWEKEIKPKDLESSTDNRPA